MSYLTREDGERFVIPSYRDVITFKQSSQLKKDILLLSQSYGEYITLQKKSPTQYEVAFSPDTGYLLGESIWHYFKKPMDLIYCEEVPNTSEALLVIVKSGSVYLDGRFPKDSIAEELVVFLTQQNSFEIYLYGDVPISQTAEPGKFSFEASSVKSFAILDKPVFATLPLLKIYQLQLVEPVLVARGIGVFPTRQLITAAIAIGLAWMLWTYITKPPVEVQEVQVAENPYQLYIDSLASPSPSDEIMAVISLISELGSMPGWSIKDLSYSKGSAKISVISNQGRLQDLMAWSSKHKMSMSIQDNGIYLTATVNVPNRSNPAKIYMINEALSVLIDRIAVIYPGNHMTLTPMTKKGNFTDANIAISFNEASPLLLNMIAGQVKNLPLVLNSVRVEVLDTTYNGSINLDVLGS